MQNSPRQTLSFALLLGTAMFFSASESAAQVNEIASATDLFTPSYRAGVGAQWIGWDDFDDGGAMNLVVNDTTPDLGNSPGSFVCNNGEPHVSSSLNIYTSDGSLDETATFNTQGTPGAGFTTIIIQGVTLFGPLGTTIDFSDVAGLQPVENIQGDNLSGSGQFWVKYEVPGNEASYTVTLSTGPFSFISMDRLVIDTFWSPTEYAVDSTVLQLPTLYDSFCDGDGGNLMGCTNCPCGNNLSAGSAGGCMNSSGTGAHLAASGDPSVSLPMGSSADLRVELTGAPASAFCILNSGDAIAPGNAANPCFGLNSGAQATAFDGLRCAILNTRRHGGRSADAFGQVGFTNSPWGGEGGPPVGIANAGGGFTSGQTRYFQVIHRDDPLAICMRGLNTSEAVEVTFAR